jgi:hypothetical protein
MPLMRSRSAPVHLPVMVVTAFTRHRISVEHRGGAGNGFTAGARETDSRLCAACGRSGGLMTG